MMLSLYAVPRAAATLAPRALAAARTKAHGAAFNFNYGGGLSYAFAAAGAVSCAAGITFFEPQPAVECLALPFAQLLPVRCGADEDIFEPGQAIGEGLKSELWKKKHPQVTILELEEGSPVLALLSHLRKAGTPVQVFSVYADRLMRALLEVAFTNLPLDEEAIFETGTGSKMQAPQLVEGLEVVAVTLMVDKDDEKKVWSRALADTFPHAEHGSVKITDLTHVSSTSLPKNMEERTIWLLSGEVGQAEPVLAALEELREAGCDDENVTLICPVMSMEACEILSKDASGLQIIAGAVDPEVDSAGQCIPGIGGFASRYSAGSFSGEGRNRRKGGGFRRLWPF